MSDALTLTTDVNYIRDDGLHVGIGYGAAQYIVYNLSDQIALIARGVCATMGSDSSAVFPRQPRFHQLRARPRPRHDDRGGRTTYGELTLGVNYKPDGPKALDGFSHPSRRLRFDQSLDGATAVQRRLERAPGDPRRRPPRSRL